MMRTAVIVGGLIDCTTTMTATDGGWTERSMELWFGGRYEWNGVWEWIGDDRGEGRALDAFAEKLDDGEKRGV